MEYELYLDVLFLVNFMMDYLILLLTSRILKIQATYIRILQGALLGAGLTCIVIILVIPSVILQFIIFHLIINSIMILITLRTKKLSEYIRGLISLYIASVLLGGVFQLFSQYVTVGSLFFGLAVISYYLVKGIWFFVEQLGKYNQEYYPVELYIGDKIIKVTALMDTGNGLRDPISQKPVCILDKVIAELQGLMKATEIFENSDSINTLDESLETDTMTINKQHYIPYNTIGNQGILTAITIDKLLIGGSKNLWINDPIIAFSCESISNNGTYQMILHPEIF